MPIKINLKEYFEIISAKIYDFYFFELASFYLHFCEIRSRLLLLSLVKRRWKCYNFNNKWQKIFLAQTHKDTQIFVSKILYETTTPCQENVWNWTNHLHFVHHQTPSKIKDWSVFVRQENNSIQDKDKMSNFCRRKNKQWNIKY